MEPMEDEPRRKIRGGCSVGRVVNLCIGFDYLLIMVTSLVVVGVLGGLNLSLSSIKGPSGPPCPLFMYVPVGVTDQVSYGAVGVCYYVEATYGVMAFISLIYFVVQVVRAVFQFDLWFTTILDLMVLLLLGVFCFAAAVTTSVGQAITCDNIKGSYVNVTDCNQPIPSKADGAPFYDLIIATQGAAWMCLLFIFLIFLTAVARVAIFFRRRTAGTPMDIDSTVLTAADDFDDKPES